MRRGVVAYHDGAGHSGEGVDTMSQTDMERAPGASPPPAAPAHGAGKAVVWSPVAVHALYFLLAATAYWIGARVGLAFVPPTGQITPVWPPNGVLLGLVLLSAPRLWWTLLSGAALACLLANLAAGREPPVAVLFALLNAAEVLLLALFLRRYRAEPYDFSTRGQVAMFTVGTLLVCGLVAIPASLLGWYFLDGTLTEGWQRWWSGDVVGVLLAAPLLIWLAQVYRERERYDIDTVVETLGLLLAHLLLCFIVFFVAPMLQRESLLDAAVYPYLTLVTLLLAAARLGPGGSAAASVLGAVMALWAQYPSASVTLIAPSESMVMSVQLFLTLTSVTGLYIGAQRSEQIAANNALRASESRFRTLATRAPVGIFLANTRGETTFINEACMAVTGLAGDEILGRAAVASFHPADRERVVDAWQRMLETGTEFREEYRFRHKDGKPRWVIGRATPIHDPDGRLDGFVGTLTDITALKDAETRLSESEMRFRQLADASPAMIWTSDAEGRCDYLNHAWLAFRGRTLGQELGWGYEEGVHPEDVARVWEVLRTSSEARTSFALEYRFQRADGEYRHVLSHGAPRYASDRAFIGYVGTAIDITPLRQAEREQIQMLERVQEAARLESIVVLAGGVAHKYNNMLTAILGNASLAELDPAIGANTREHLERIQETAMQAADLTRKLLAYSGRTSPLRRPASLSQIVEDTTPLLRTSITGQARLDLDLDEDIAYVSVDSALIQQVLVNLFANAVEALDGKGGAVCISTGMRHCSAELIASLGTSDEMAEGNYAFLQVSDNGVGIADNIRDRIFEPFFSTHFAGRGLGLAAVQGIVRSHGGALHVASRPGEGAAFTIYFPVATLPPATI